MIISCQMQYVTCVGVPFGQLLHLIKVYDLFVDDNGQIAYLRL